MRIYLSFLITLFTSFAFATSGTVDLGANTGGSGGGGSGNATSIQGIPVSATAPTLNQILEYNGTSYVPTTIGGTGTVTSVGLALPSFITVSGSPVTSTGTLTGTLASQTQNLIFASPNGSSGAPTFRSLVAADVPTLNQNTTGTASNITATSNSTLTTLSSLSLPYSQLSGTIPTWNQNTTGTAANITATSNSTLTTLSALSLPGSQVTGNISGNAANITATSNSTLTTLSALSLPYSQVTGAPAAITALTGDVTASGPGSAAATLATVNVNTGPFGSSTAIPNFTVNGKGLITAAGTNAVIAPAGTLSGTTLNSTVVSSSLTSVGTITSGTWNGTTLDVAHGGSGITSASANQVIIAGTTSTSPWTIVPGGSSGLVLTSNGTTAAPTWQASSGSGTVTSVGFADASTTPIYSITNTPVTTSGTLTQTLTTQNANTFFAGPTSGAAAQPAFRAISTLDTPLPMIYFFGDGSDGALNCTGSITLTRDMFYSSATFGAGCALNTTTYRIFVTGTCDFTAAPAGSLFANGGAGGTGGATGTAGTGGTPATQGSWLSPGSANAGGAGGITTGTNGNVGGSANTVLGGGPAISGAGGTGTSGNTGGAAGAAGTPVGFITFRRFTTDFSKAGAATAMQVHAASARASSGGGGGGDGTTSGGGGGGGGGPAGGVYLSCYNINRGGSTAAGTIQAKGGNGGAGGTPTTGTGPAGGGGGSGGGGGVVYIAYFTLSGSTATNMIDVSGGAGGGGGTSRGTATTGGTGGGGGGSGRVTFVNIGGATSSETIPVAASAGSGPTGLTGGAGASAVTSQVSL